MRDWPAFGAHGRGFLIRAARLAAALVLALGLVLSRPGLALGPWSVLAADATPTPAAAGDPRSSGEGAGLVGRPFLAIGGMVAIGLLAAAGTIVYVRMTGGPRRD